MPLHYNPNKRKEAFACAKAMTVVMKYISTRGMITSENAIGSADAIKRGLAPDGGLFMPLEFPKLSKEEIEKYIPLSYPERAFEILSKFLTDYPGDVLKKACLDAYSEKTFEKGAAPIKKVCNDLYSLELWHGPTCAFKDEALQIMPKLLSAALKITNEPKTAFILVATSGDTGKAALEGYRDVDKVKIMVYYPSDGVSAVQKKQMATQEGENVEVCAVHGNFDDAQSGVKKIFSDPDAQRRLNEKGYFFSSANSINWGRLVPQIVYYVSAYCDLIKTGDIKNGDKISFAVPTGNFGNILAAYIAKEMGLPVSRLICASNTNNVLTDFLKTGTYDKNRTFHTTMSPSMDILISSNLERLLYLCAGCDKTAEYMRSLAQDGKYTVSSDVMEKIEKTFVGEFASENDCKKTIKETFEKYGYLCDPHTAVSIFCAKKLKKANEKIVVASTASPFKFAADVCRCLGHTDFSNDFEAIDALSLHTGAEIPRPIASLSSKKVRFSDAIDPDQMKETTLSKIKA